MGLYKHDDYGYDKDDDYSGLMSGFDEIEQPSFARKEKPSIVEPEDDYSCGILKHHDDFVPSYDQIDSCRTTPDDVSKRLDNINENLDKKVNKKQTNALIRKLASTSSQDEIRKLLIDNFGTIQDLCKGSNKESDNGKSRTRTASHNQESNSDNK